MFFSKAQTKATASVGVDGEGVNERSSYKSLRHWWQGRRGLPVSGPETRRGAWPAGVTWQKRRIAGGAARPRDGGSAMRRSHVASGGARSDGCRYRVRRGKWGGRRPAALASLESLPRRRLDSAPAPLRLLFRLHRILSCATHTLLTPNMQAGPHASPGAPPSSAAMADASPLVVQDHLVSIPGALVHLVDDPDSVFLGSGAFSIVRIAQHNQGIVALVRVGDALQWPLMSDEHVLKLDPIHYVFSLPVPPTLDYVAAVGTAAAASERAQGGENMRYGVTFSEPGQEEALKTLDQVLECYSFFSLPTLVHGDKQKEAADQGLAANTATGQVETSGAALVPPSVVAGDGKQITEENQRVFWSEMAPNVDDYDNRVAKAIATGTGHIIRGIFWVRDSTVLKLENGAMNMTKQSNPTDKPTNMSPSTLRNLQRVNGMTKATDNFAKSVLSGVVSTVGIIPNAIAKSGVGRAFFRTGPGEVALVSMVSFWNVFDAVEQASRDVLRTSTSAAATVVTHKHGESAGKATEEALGSAGHLMGTAWSAAKVPKALNPTAAFKPSKATITGLHAPKPTQ